MIVNQSICNGCNQPIMDPYILKVDNRKWCYACLKCDKCKCPLIDKCWFKQNKFYCKDDYNELIQQMISCSICKKPIEKNTLKYTIFNRNMHLQCMKCCECDKLLSSGDHFIKISDNQFACTNHLNNNQKYLKSEIKNEKEQFNKSLNYQNNKPALDTILENDHHLNNSINNHLNQHNLNDNSMNLIDYSNNFNYLINDDFSATLDNQLPASNVDDENYSSFINNYWTQVNYNQNLSLNENKQIIKSKVRSKKIQTSNFSNESESNCNESFNISLYEQDNLNDSNSISNLDLISPSSSNHHHNQNSNSSSASSSINSDFSNSSNSSTNFSSKITSSSLKSNQRTNQSLKTKRLRTSFKANQLKELKNYFQSQQNPDSKQLLVLSQQIKINKRVLQVWFQNSRAAYRKKTQTSYNPKFKNYNSSYEISN